MIDGTMAVIAGALAARIAQMPAPPVFPTWRLREMPFRSKGITGRTGASHKSTFFC
jgi:hypothetical protein